MKVDLQNGTQPRAVNDAYENSNVYVFPLTFAQQRLWFLDQLQPGNSSYSVPWSIRIEGKLDVAALDRSLRKIVRRHEILRTTFSVENGEPVQVVHESMRLNIPVLDLSCFPDREEKAKQAAIEEARQPVDLRNGPLVRGRLLRLGENDHVLLLTLHHIIFDGWSRRILVRELASLYEAFRYGKPSPLPDLKLQYPDYAVWQRKHFKGKNLEKQLAFWKEQLAGAPAALDLPTDRSRPAVQTFQGAVLPFALPQSLSQSLHELCRRNPGVTPFMALLAGFQLLLARYSGQDDIVVGTPIANRNRAEIEEMLGFFANTLVLRTKIASGVTFDELLQQVKTMSLGAYAHQDMPFEKLVEELHPERSLTHNPLFQVLFSLQNARRQAFELSGLKLTPLESASNTAKFDISLFLVEHEGGFRGRIEYNTDLFDRSTMERMLEHYQVLLAAAVDDPSRKVSLLPLLPEPERTQLISGWNATEFDYPRDLCLHQAFEQHAARTPEAIACQFEDQQLSYGELNARANQIAHFLQSRGIARGQRVGIFIERSLDMMAGLLGIQKSGAAYVPLDPSYPVERLRLTLDDAQVPVLLTQKSLLSSMPEHQAEVVCLDSEWNENFATQSTANPHSLVTPDDLVYVIFTSGSTGRPKGVQVPHGGVVNLLSFMAHELRMGPDDVFPALASFAFDMCIPELYLALVSGGRVVIGNRHLAANGEELAEVLRATGSTIVHATPTTWSLLLEAGFSGKGLKRIIGAEPLPRELCRRLLEADPSLYNFYGPTETTVWSAFHHFRSTNEPIVVGRPLANTQIYILDKNLQPAPIGVPGEIHIGGDGVTHGYLNRPELTAEKFIADRFSGKPNAKMYKTGDLGRFLPDGRIEFQGRADNQVKVRGYRIELGEIESALAQHASVQECAVIAREDVEGDKRLVGYVVPAANLTINPGDLRAWVKDRLPEYMVPVAFVTMERLPLSPNGKVDRRNLPAPDYARPDTAGEYQGANSPTQEVIAGIWVEVLKLDQVGIQDNFFELGGHSLLATQVISRIRQAFTVELPLRSLFETPTVAGLSDRVEKLQNEKRGLTAPAIVPVPRNQPLPLSFSQQRLWFLDQLEPDNPLYNVPYVVRMRGPLHAAILERSIQEIVRRHETLRTSFQTFKDEPVQVIAPRLNVPLAVTDLTSTPERDREEEARARVMEEVKRPFNLQISPLLRASLIKLADDDHVVILNTHHIISDRWSLGVLSQELIKLYEAYKEDRSSPLADLHIQYADYAQWQRRYLSGDTLNQQLEYWKHQLAGAPASLDLPTDHPRPPIQSYNGTQKSVVLPKALLDKLRELSRREGATFFMTLLAAFDVLLSRSSGQQDIVVGSPIAGRTRSEIEKLIGFFVNTLVLRSDVSGNPTFRELLGRVRETAMGAYAHQDLPFEKLVEELKPERDLSRNPLFQVMLILQNAPSAGRSMADITAGPFASTGTSSKFDLTLIAAETSEGFRATLEYNTDLFEAATIDRMLGHLHVLLDAVATDPTQQVNALPVLTREERQQLLAEFNRTEADYPRDLCLHELFTHQAAKTPDRVAVVFGDQQITYAELNARANQLARYLKKNGAGPDTLVGLFVERSLDMLVGLLGILKAGAAYVPLDPAYPKDRIAFILEDARAPLLITQASLLSSLPNSTTQHIYLDSDWAHISGESTDDLANQSQPESLAYVLYTSGSTGKPKGVQIAHRSLVNFLASMQREPGLAQDDVLLAVTTLSFDIAGLELYLPLVTGAKVVLASRDQASDGQQLLTLLTDSKATIMQATPATWRMLLEVGWTGSPQLKALCGGEALPPELAEEMRNRCTQVWNMYGPTETTIWSSVYRVTRPLSSTAPIGRPIANTTMHVLDSELQPVPVGVAGELYIGGDGLARGYLNRPELTSDKFVRNPFLTNARLYRTGDLARYLPDGNIQFLGRADFQVKLRGFRIELGEIESALSQHSAVQQSVVVVREDTPGDKRLVAYIVAKAGEDASPGSLRAHLKQSLPEYMIPGIFVSLASLPLTPNGKINRLALPAPEPALFSIKDYVPPSNPTEQAVAAVWQEVLRVERVGIHANFFELGGHSLLATQVVSRIQRHLGLALPLRSLFEHPTVAQLSAAIATIRADQPLADATIPVLPRLDANEHAFPLSFAQQRLFVLNRLEPNSAAYNIPMALRLKGSLNRTALEHALDHVIARHEILRTRYDIYNGEPVQVIQPTATLAIETIDLSSIPASQRESRASELAREEAQRVFQLSDGIPIRASLLAFDQLDHLLLITVHHIAFDGWSAGTLLNELAGHYNAALAQQSSTAPAVPVQYADYATWQRNQFQGEALDHQLSYWKRQLASAPASIDLPTDRPRPAQQTFHGATRTASISKALLDQLQDLSRRHNTTLFMAVLAAFNVLLSRYSRQEDLVIGTPIAGRNRPELENLIGVFVNTLVLRCDLSGDPTFAEVLAHVRTTAMDAYTNQDVPFERLVEELKPERDMSRNPLFQIMFILQNMPREKWQMTGLTVAPFKSDNTTEKFDLTVNLIERPNELKATFSYNTALFEEATIARMLAHFETLLAEIVADPARRVSEIALLSSQEESQVLKEFNRTDADFRRDLCIHNFFEAQAARTPSNVALVSGDDRLTYADLNHRANRVAHYLRKRGVGPETLVGICIERSINLLVGILGILKSGGAYVPLDPAYPPDRLRNILEDAKAPVLLTQQSLLEILPQQATEVICLDTDWPKIAAEPADNPKTSVTPENLAYVLFTSGSTGRPKGVALEHRSASTFIQWAQSVYTPAEVAGTLFSTSMSFDLSVFEMFVPLSMGGKAILVQNALFLPAAPAANEVTLINTVPSAIAELLRMNGVPDSVRVVNLAGEPLPTALAAQIYEKSKVEKVYNLYGPTEDTTYSTFTLVPRGSEVTIGKPLANTQVYILDNKRKPVPVGVPGELHLAGEGLARGYFGRPDLTAERFLLNPFSSQPGARMYRTGDLARFLPDGEIQYLGRIDNQVKLRGFRIELGEIESVLTRHASVQSAIVVVREDQPGDKRLVAYVASPQREVTDTDLRAFVKGSLPEYMIPSAFMVLETMPLTPNGKIDRRALPKPDPAAHSTSAIGPRDDYELTLLGIWRRVLGVENIGVTDNFFEIGGHSLLAVRLLTEIKAATGREIPLSALFQGATIEYMAQLLHTDSQELPHLTVTQVQRGGNLPPFFVAVVPGANSLGYLTLARYIGLQQPLYKLQGPGPRLKQRPYTAEEFEKLAFDSIQAMRSVQPQGPYYIGGMCGGARIAFDIARLLEAQGQEVRLLAIFDTWVVENSQRRSLWYFHYYYQRLQKFRLLPASQKREMFLSAVRKKARKLSNRVEKEQSPWQQSYWPGKDFQPPKYHGRITLFKIPRQPFYYIRDPLMGWGNRTTGGVDIEFIRSEHLKLLRQPYVQELGQKLSQCLQRAQRGDAHSNAVLQVSLPSAYAATAGTGTPGAQDHFASVMDDQADE